MAKASSPATELEVGGRTVRISNPLLGALDRLLPDAGARHAVLWETPCRLFGFGDAGV